MDAAADLRREPLTRWRRRVGSWDIRMEDEPTAARQMARDEQLAREGRPTLRLFRWAAPAFSIGYRQRPPSWVDAGALAARGIELVERPTGGGIAVHGTDLSCSVTAPRFASGPLAVLMERIGRSMTQACRAGGAQVEWQPEEPRAGPFDVAQGSALSAVERAGPIAYCLTQRSPYAVTAGARKLCGFAIRAYEASWLVQGSLLVRPVSALHRAVMPEEVAVALSRRAISLEESAGQPIAWKRLIDRFIEAWGEMWRLPCSMSPALQGGVHDEMLAHAGKGTT